jgi:hypothetical protein
MCIVITLLMYIITVMMIKFRHLFDAAIERGDIIIGD